MTHIRPISTEALGILAQPGTPVAAIVAVKFAVLVTTWATRRRTRLALKGLEAWQLRDVGLTEGEASTEASLPFWRV